MVRVPWTSYKVSTVVGAEIWDLFRPAADPFLQGLAEGRCIHVSGELTATGELWPNAITATVGVASDVFAFGTRLSDAAVALPSLPPAFRHPVQVSEFVYLGDSNCTEEHGNLCWQPSGLPLDRARATIADFDDETLRASKAAFGLVRFDGGGFRFQPLAVLGKGKSLRAGQNALKSSNGNKSKTLPILRERAGRLLRR
jgi:hypothetical protein